MATLLVDDFGNPIMADTEVHGVPMIILKARDAECLICNTDLNGRWSILMGRTATESEASFHLDCFGRSSVEKINLALGTAGLVI